MGLPVVDASVDVPVVVTGGKREGSEHCIGAQLSAGSIVRPTAR